MRNLCKCTTECAKDFNIMDFGLLKLCCISAGLISGMFVPKKCKKATFITSYVIFGLTLVPLLIKFIKVLAKDRD